MPAQQKTPEGVFCVCVVLQNSQWYNNRMLNCFLLAGKGLAKPYSVLQYFVMVVVLAFISYMLAVPSVGLAQVIPERLNWTVDTEGNILTRDTPTGANNKYSGMVRDTTDFSEGGYPATTTLICNSAGHAIGQGGTHGSGGSGVITNVRTYGVGYGNCAGEDYYYLLTSNTAETEFRYYEVYWDGEYVYSSTYSGTSSELTNYAEIEITNIEDGDVTASTTVTFDVSYFVEQASIGILKVREYNLGSTGEEIQSHILPNSGNGTTSFTFNLTGTTTYYATPCAENYIGGAQTCGKSVYFHALATSTNFLEDLNSGNFFVSTMKRIREEFLYKVPWGYFTLIKLKYESIQEDTSLADLDIVLPMEDLSTDFGAPALFPDITIFSFNWLNATSSRMASLYSSWISLNTYASYFLWFVFGLWVYRYSVSKGSEL